VQVVLNVSSKSPIVSYGYRRSVYSKKHGSHSQPTLFTRTRYTTTNYGDQPRRVHLSPFMTWHLHGCGKPKFVKLDWIASIKVTIHTKTRTITGAASKNAGPAAGGAVIFP
jgi:hypothetical protein